MGRKVATMNEQIWIPEPGVGLTEYQSAIKNGEVITENDEDRENHIRFINQEKMFNAFGFLTMAALPICFILVIAIKAISYISRLF